MVGFIDLTRVQALLHSAVPPIRPGWLAIATSRADQTYSGERSIEMNDKSTDYNISLTLGGNIARSTRRPVGRLGDFVHMEDNIIGSAMQMTARLRDHIERLDNGVVYAADDLAVVLRAMLVESKGNRVLRRLYEAFNIDCPEIILSRPPLTDEDVQFSVGSIPIREPGALADGAISTPLRRWSKTPVVVVALGGDQVAYTWGDFMNDYANKWGGAHLSTIVPQHLQFIDYYSTGGLSLTSYLLRSAAVEVWRLAQNAFRLAMPSLLGKDFALDEIKQARYFAEGGLTIEPRDVSAKGQLQWFHHGKKSLGMVWYVDGQSFDNALHLTLGAFPYDVAYNPAGEMSSGKPVPAAFQAPRHRNVSQPAKVDRATLRTLTLDARIRTLAEVRASQSSP
jgi:hypothetical protein